MQLLEQLALSVNFKGVPVEHDKKVRVKLIKDLKILKTEYPRIMNDVEQQLFTLSQKWNCGFSNPNDIRKYMILDSVSYEKNNDGGTFMLWYNNENKNKNDAFFDGHCVYIKLTVSDTGRINDYNWKLMG